MITERFARKVLQGLLSGTSGCMLFLAFLATGAGASDLAIGCILLSLAAATMAALAAPP